MGENDKPIKWDRVRRAFLDELDETEDLSRGDAFNALRMFSEERSEGNKEVEELYYQTLEPDLEDWLEDQGIEE